MTTTPQRNNQASEKTLMDTLSNAHAQIEEKQYEAGLIAEGVRNKNSGRIVLFSAMWYHEKG